MKNVDLYILGIYFDVRNKDSEAIFYLHYCGAVMKRVRRVKGIIGHGRLELMAILDALTHLKEPCNIDIHTKVYLGFDQIGTSCNKDLLVQIVEKMTHSGHRYNMVKDYEFKAVGEWELDNRVKSLRHQNNLIQENQSSAESGTNGSSGPISDEYYRKLQQRYKSHGAVAARADLGSDRLDFDDSEDSTMNNAVDSKVNQMIDNTFSGATLLNKETGN